jgi:hypothetical protein
MVVRIDHFSSADLGGDEPPRTGTWMTRNDAAEFVGLLLPETWKTRGPWAPPEWESTGEWEDLGFGGLGEVKRAWAQVSDELGDHTLIDSAEVKRRMGSHLSTSDDEEDG